MYAGSSEFVRKYNCGIVIDLFDVERSASMIADLFQNDGTFKKFKTTRKEIIDSGNYQIDETVKRTIKLYS
jgi:hypothetical protein